MTLRIDPKNTVSIPNIIRLAGDCNYSVVYTETEEYTISKTLLALESLLPTFLRVHKEHLLNPACVKGHQIQCKGYDRRQTLTLIMKDGERIDVSRRRYTTIRSALGLTATRVG